MPVTPLPDNIVDIVRDLQRRIHTLETAAPMRATSMTAGTTIIKDDAGIARVAMGLIADDEYGLAVYNADGALVYEANAAGVVVPRQDGQITKANDTVTATSASFVRTWSATFTVVVADAIQVQAVVGADAATTGEARLAVNVGGVTYAATQTIAAGTADPYEWKWAIPGLVVGTGPIVVDLEVRRTGGAGDLHVYAPLQAAAATAASIGATATGV